MGVGTLAAQACKEMRISDAYVVSRADIPQEIVHFILALPAVRWPGGVMLAAQACRQARIADACLVTDSKVARMSANCQAVSGATVRQFPELGGLRGFTASRSAARQGLRSHT